MTDRHKGYVVTLENDIREDDAAEIVKLIGMVKGVIAVQPIVNDISTMIAEERAREEIRNQLFDLLYPYARKKK